MDDAELGELMRQYHEKFGVLPPLIEMAHDDITLAKQLRDSLESGTPFESKLDPKTQTS